MTFGSDTDVNARCRARIPRVRCCEINSRKKKRSKKTLRFDFGRRHFCKFHEEKNAHRGEALNYARKQVLINYTRNRHMYLLKDGQCIYLFMFFKLMLPSLKQRMPRFCVVEVVVLKWQPLIKHKGKQKNVTWFTSRLNWLPFVLVV